MKLTPNSEISTGSALRPTPSHPTVPAILQFGTKLICVPFCIFICIVNKQTILTETL